MTRRAAAAAAIVVAFATSAFALDASLRKQAKDPDAAQRSAAARALGRDGSADAMGVLVDLLDDRAPAVRDAAVIACGDVAAPAAVEILAKAASSKDELLRRNVADALGRTKSPAAVAALAKLVRKDPSAAVRAVALDALWAFAKDADAYAAARDALADADPSARAAAVEAVGRIDADAAVEAVTKALDDPHEAVRCVARMELRYIARAAASARFANGLADPSWRVRAQIVDDAFWIRDAASMSALAALTGDAELRVADAAHFALRLLTGRDLGRDADLWKGWWEQNRTTWTPPHGRLDTTKPAEPADGATRATYHGVGVATARVAFVVDFSGSMRRPMSKIDTRPRWDVAREELTRTLAALPDGAAANVLLFQDEVKRAFDRAAPLDAGARKTIEGFLRATPGERGNLLAALLEAIADDGVDTVFLLSDGAPGAGDLVDRVRVAAAVRRANRTRKVLIHTIGFGAETAVDRGFLESLARESGGRCVLR